MTLISKCKAATVLQCAPANVHNIGSCETWWNHGGGSRIGGRGPPLNAVLNAVKDCLAVQSENAITSIARTRPIKTLWSLFSIEGHFGKLAFYH
jgi:hypothetical protein